MSAGLLVQEKKFNIHFQDARRAGHLGFPILFNLFIYLFIYLQIALILATKFRVIRPFSSGEEAQKIDFQNGGNGGHLGIQIKTILAIFDLQVVLILPTKFRVNWSFGSGAEAPNRFTRWISEFSFFFLSTSHPDASYQVSGQLAFYIVKGKRREAYIFKMAAMAVILDFRSEWF